MNQLSASRNLAFRLFLRRSGVVLGFAVAVVGYGCRSAEQPLTANSSGDQASEDQVEAEEASSTNLLDGNLDLWRGYKSDSVPSSWQLDSGELSFEAGRGGRGDIVTVSQYSDFDLRLEWKVAEAGNSGIFFAVSEDFPATYNSGPEMQVLHNAGHVDGKNPLTSAGSNYALHAPTQDVTRPVGEYNEVRLRVEGPRVRQWLNGVLVVEYERWTPEWRELVAASKFKSMPGYGLNRRGHIALQDHGDPVSYRNISITDLAP